MVENKEIVVLFKRKKLDLENEEFIPYKVELGYYNEEDNWFVGTNEAVYPHITEGVVSGICYGIRYKLNEFGANLTKEKIKLIKKDLFDYANLFIYKRNRNDGFHIITIDKETLTEDIFEDKDTEFMYSQYGKNHLSLDKISEQNLNLKSLESYTPKELTSEVIKTIKGQDKAIKKIVTAILTTKKHPTLTKRNMLIIGPTGVGKTETFRTIQRLTGTPLTIFSIPGLSQAGYQGRSTDELLKQIYFDNNQEIELAENGIVILDEIDKLAYGGTNSGDISTSGVQNELLKIIEGGKRIFEIEQDYFKEIDTSNILFIATGAFSELYKTQNHQNKAGFIQEEEVKNTKISREMIKKYGLKDELLRRFPVIIELNALNKENLKDILLNSSQSELTKTINALKEENGVEITNISEFIDVIAEDAVNKGIGASGLITTVEEIFEDIFYEVDSDPKEYDKITLGKDILNNNEDYTLHKKSKKKILKKTN